jgi:hypothetical protein
MAFPISTSLHVGDRPDAPADHLPGEGRSLVAEHPDYPPDARFDAFRFQGALMAPLGDWAYAPRIPTSAAALTNVWPMDFAVEFKYHSAVGRIAERFYGDDDPQARLLAVLIAESAGFQRSVRVDLIHRRQRATAGYLNGKHGQMLVPVIEALMDGGALPVMRAHLAPIPTNRRWRIVLTEIACSADCGDDTVSVSERMERDGKMR